MEICAPDLVTATDTHTHTHTHTPYMHSPGDIGKPKAEVAAKFVNDRVSGCNVAPYPSAVYYVCVCFHNVCIYCVCVCVCVCVRERERLCVYVHVP